MPNCPSCEACVSDDSRYCPHCGSPATVLQAQFLPPTEDNEDLTGINGWLILIVIGLVISALNGMITGITDLIHTSSYISIYEIALGTACVICLVLMFKKSRLFPKLYIGLLSVNIGMSLLMIVSSILMHRNLMIILPRTIVSIACSGTWIAYMLRSKRVKNTFIR